MSFGQLLKVATMPVVQVLIISLLGAFLATDYLNLLSAATRRSLNMIVFKIFTPSLMFASLAETVTFEDLVAMWFMPINVGLCVVIGAILGWLTVKILKPEPYLEGLLIGTCSSGNLGNLLLIIVSAVCKESGSPFGDPEHCSSIAISYVSFSMAVGGFYIWTFTYQQVRNSSLKYKALVAAQEGEKIPNKDLDGNRKTCLLVDEGDIENQERECFIWGNLAAALHQVAEELMSPPTLAAIIGFTVGAIPMVKDFIIGDHAPLRVIQDTIKLLGAATIPCITLILGGNLTQGLHNSRLKLEVIIAIIFLRCVILPVIGIGLVRAASNLGLLPSNPLFQYVLMIQFTVPPAMNVATITQLFDVAQEECSVLMLWTYVAAAFALAVWSTVYMWILS
ncbi:hypothetical protein NMG60_11026448 [Bertholletia excelsa]